MQSPCYFGRFLIFFRGVIYEVDITPRKKIKKRLKRTQKSTEPNYARGLIKLARIQGQRTPLPKGQSPISQGNIHNQLSSSLLRKILKQLNSFSFKDLSKTPQIYLSRKALGGQYVPLYLRQIKKTN